MREAPRSEDEPEPRPAAGGFRAETREAPERLECHAYALAGVARERVRQHESIQVRNSGAGEFDLSHVLQLVQRDGVSRCRLLGTELGAFPGTVDPVE